MVSFVEHDAGGALRMVSSARGVDHDKRVVCDDEIGLGRAARGTFDKALPVMRAASIDAFAALIGQRRDPALAEQRAEPARQIAADHVAILRVCGPARDQLRQDRCAPRKSALQCVFKIEQAEIVFAALAHYHRL